MKHMVTERQEPELEDSGASLKQLRNDYEKKVIQKILKECNGNISETARRLKVSRSTIIEKLKMN
jgi:DNA-binding NtrC family response regulator